MQRNSRLQSENLLLVQSKHFRDFINLRSCFILFFNSKQRTINNRQVRAATHKFQISKRHTTEFISLERFTFLFGSCLLIEHYEVPVYSHVRHLSIISLPLKFYFVTGEESYHILFGNSYFYFIYVVLFFNQLRHSREVTSVPWNLHVNCFVRCKIQEIGFFWPPSQITSIMIF